MVGARGHPCPKSRHPNRVYAFVVCRRGRATRGVSKKRRRALSITKWSFTPVLMGTRWIPPAISCGMHPKLFPVLLSGETTWEHWVLYAFFCCPLPPAHTPLLTHNTGIHPLPQPQCSLLSAHPPLSPPPANTLLPCIPHISHTHTQWPTHHKQGCCTCLFFSARVRVTTWSAAGLLLGVCCSIPPCMPHCCPNVGGSKSLSRVPLF